MLRIKDQKGKTVFVLRDDDEQPVSIDDLVLNESQKPKKKEKQKEEEKQEEEEK